MQLTDLNIGVLFIFGISGLGVYGVALAGWASNNKYALMGGLRSSAQMISYELPMALAIAAPLLLLNTLSLREIANGQAGFYLGFIPRWSIFQMPFPQIFSFILFLIAGFAETNRVPFDLPEAENELVAGFHVEYASMKFASFFMAEYANMVTVSCVATLLFLGGWHPIFPEKYGSGLIPVLIFAASAGCCASFMPPIRRGLSTGSRCRCSACCSWARAGLFLIPRGAADSAAAVLVLRRRSLRHPVRVHLGPRDAAAVPLRSVDALRLDLHVPRGAGQLVHYGPPGGPFPLIWTLSCS